VSIRILRVDLGVRSYPIRIGSGLLGSPAAYGEVAGRKLVLLTDSNVAAHYLPMVRKVLPLADEDILILPPGESLKTWDQAGAVLDWMLSRRLPRDGVLAALGGGVIGDLGGFCASVYQRGIDFLQIPTTLLAQVDSSVGGKTAVNHPAGKNMIGAFHQPLSVIADIDTLATLPPREFSAGLAEVIKYGMLGDANLFEWLESNLDRLMQLQPQLLAEAVERCCSIKARIVGQDERETGGARALLNLGHTFGHAIETWAGYGNWLHGEAVAVGLVMAADLSARLDWVKRPVVNRCETLIARAGLPVKPPVGMKVEEFSALMGLDKKVKGGKLRLILMRALGEAVLTSDFDPGLLAATLGSYCAEPDASA